VSSFLVQFPSRVQVIKIQHRIEHQEVAAGRLAAPHGIIREEHDVAVAQRAGHDAQDMVRLGPVGMIFIPSVGGISHSPKEFSRPQDIANGANGANVLLHAVLKLDRANL
jgi:acetylornithine deacetylase/succinyl-diaminopimelate desuccinylase-like protein